MKKLYREHFYWNTLLKGRNRYFAESLRKKYPALMRYLEECIKNNTCPVCKKMFRNKAGLFSHLERVDCRRIIEKIIDKIGEKEKEDRLLSLIR